MSYTDEQREFLDGHTWAILATGRKDGSPQQSMVGYAVDELGRLVVSAKSYTAKWNNARREPNVCVTVPDGRVHLTIYGTAETIDGGDELAALTADVFAALSGSERPDPSTLAGTIAEQQRTILRITPDRVLFHD